MRTTRKFDEAKFFLDLLEENTNEDPQFDYFLNAFISSARSILWIMRAEFSDIKGWEQWFGSLNPSKEEISFLKKVNDMRVRSLKSDPLLTRVHMKVDILDGAFTEEVNEYLKRLDGKNVTFTIETLEEDIENQEYGIIEQGTVKLRGKVNGVVRALDDFPDRDILDICKEYYYQLKTIVDECLEKFSDKITVKNNGKLRIKMNKVEE
ncbi:hypothetical protein PO903_16725 [Paenibacillus sp. PK4536]|uniref:hypothetical protein n=1 Tax=Paenibacillus sp. PK4536 TaxID=3024576 RepID=UPI0023589CBD|nr:hypothetical protein [Paenibacillus sp. PK4536]WIM38283.1 hypothetical protein PO903_16725 [Paenibacillus sp. PK4536]